MNKTLYRLVYCSRNRLRGTAEEMTAEIQDILTKARVNNAAAAITGALLYNSGNFAQVLEGPVDAVGCIFEKIQRDARHSEVTIVQNGIIEKRQFPDWSMGFSTESSGSREPLTPADFEAVFSQSVDARERILFVLQELVLQEDGTLIDW